MNNSIRADAAETNSRASIFLIPLFTGFFLIMILIGSYKSASANPLFNHSERAAMREIREIAENAASLLNVYMDARVTEMLVCSKLGGPIRDALSTSGLRNDASQVLEELFKSSGAYDALFLLDKRGVCLASAPVGLINQDLSKNEAFNDAITGKLTVTDAHKSEILRTLNPKSKGWTVVIAAPVKAENDIAGVLMSCVNLARLRGLLGSIRVGVPFVQEYPTGRVEISSGLVYVLNSKNQMIIHPMEEYSGKTLAEIGAPLEISDAIKRKVSNQRYNFRNPLAQTEKKLAGFAYPKGYGKFPELGWVVGAYAAEEELIGAPWWLEIFR